MSSIFGSVNEPLQTAEQNTINTAEQNSAFRPDDIIKTTVSSAGSASTLYTNNTGVNVLLIVETLRIDNTSSSSDDVAFAVNGTDQILMTGTVNSNAGFFGPKTPVGYNGTNLVQLLLNGSGVPSPVAVSSTTRAVMQSSIILQNNDTLDTVTQAGVSYEAEITARVYNLS